MLVLTWPLTSWSLFTGLYFTLKSPVLAKKTCFSINFIKNFVIYFGPGTSLFDKNKDEISGEILFFGNILGFLGINWAQKWTKIVNFRCVLFPLKRLISKDCSDLSLSYTRPTSGQNFSKLEPNLGEKGPETLKRDHIMDAASPQKHLEIYILITTNATLMKLIKLCTSIRHLIWLKTGV